MARAKFLPIFGALMVLGLAVATASDRHWLYADAQAPAKPAGKAANVHDLRKERLAVARELLKQVTQRVKNNEGSTDELSTPTRLVFEAELDLCESAQDRITVLQDYVTAAKAIETSALRAAQSGIGRQSTVLAAKVERLRVEIALHQAGNAKDTQKPGGEKNPAPGGNAKSARITTQPGSIEPFASVRLHPAVPGFLKTQNVDIGDRVKRGQVLAVLDAPDLEKQVALDTASVAQARARIAQAKARLEGAQADLQSAKFGLIQAEAFARSAAASVQFRAKQFERVKSLAAANSIDGKLVDEAKERYDASVESEKAAKAAAASAQAHMLLKEANIEQVKGDIRIREAGVNVAQATLDKSRQQLAFATIHVPFDGVVTRRNYFVGDMIRPTDNTPLLTVERTDMVRVVVMVPQRDALLVKVGQEAQVALDALPGKKWSTKVSRIGVALDSQTRSMRVELDLANSTGQIHTGMYGVVSIALDK